MNKRIGGEKTLLVGLVSVAGGVVISKLQEKLSERLIDKAQSSDSYIGKITRKIIGEREIGRFSAEEFKELLLEIYQETPELKIEIDERDLATIIDKSIKQSLEQLTRYENNQNYEGLQKWLTEELGYLQEELVVDLHETLQKLQNEMTKEIDDLKKQRQILIKGLIDNGKNITKDNEAQLIEQSQSIIQELRCPNCGGYPLKEKRKEYKCQYCDSVFKKNNYTTEQEIKKLTFEKLQRLSALQLGYATMSSRNDRPYDPEKFIIRKDLQQSLDKFIKNKFKKAFLLLGEAGFGKTWAVSHEALKLLDQQYPVFYITLREGIEQLFEAIFNADRKMIFSNSSFTLI